MRHIFTKTNKSVTLFLQYEYGITFINPAPKNYTISQKRMKCA